MAGYQMILKKPVERYGSTKVLEVEATVKTKPPALDGQNIMSKQGSKSQVWDCESSLYDSFELNSFNRQLDSAIKDSSRSFSMPHLSDRRAPPLTVSTPVQAITTLTKHQTKVKKASKLSNKSFKKIMKLVFGSSTNVSNGANNPFITKTASNEKHRSVSFSTVDPSRSVRVLNTIQEMREIDDTPVVRRATSGRFTVPLVSVSCYSRY